MKTIGKMFPLEAYCLYCGERVTANYDGAIPYYECNCADAKLKRELEDKIQELQRQIPKYRYKFCHETFIVEIGEDK